MGSNRDSPISEGLAVVSLPCLRPAFMGRIAETPLQARLCQAKADATAREEMS
jgi:hypothetical protein